MKPIHSLRENYKKGNLDITDVCKDPVEQFNEWLKEAIASEILEPNAMVLSTINENRMPTARVVLLKEVTKSGFVFYTNYESDKGKDLAINPIASLTFLWKELERQVRIQGSVVKISKERSESYFHSRPRGSQIGAWTSPQSRVISDRKLIEDKQKYYEHEFQKEDKIPLPDNWGGYELTPNMIEFWQGRPSRLHDRIRFKREDKDWTIERLAP